jgi:hypothetical protein
MAPLGTPWVATAPHAYEWEEGGMVVKKGPRAKEAEAEDFFTRYQG